MLFKSDKDPSLFLTEKELLPIANKFLLVWNMESGRNRICESKDKFT
jgi:hypothetical protein